MDRKHNDKWGAVNRRDGQTIQWQMRSSKSSFAIVCLSISPIYCSSFAIVLSVHLSDLLLLVCHCIVCPSLKDRQYHGKWGAINQRDGQTIQWQMRSSKSERWTDNTMPSLWFIAPHLPWYCLSFSDLLLLICHCIVCPSLRFTAPHLSLYCLRQYNDKWGAINRRQG
jgi:hypothetical protein